MLNVKNLTAAYFRDHPVLKGIDLTVGNHEVVGIIGQNGSGKSTLAKAIMNLVPHLSGEIFYYGQNILGKKTHELSDIGIGYFPQGGRTFPNLTVKENLEFVCRVLNARERNTRLSEIMEIFSILKTEKMKMKASYLSGGEQYQLALAMVLMQKPKFLILDEPSAGLSPANVKGLYDTLYKIKEKKVKSILIIEQNVSVVIEFSNRVVLLQEGTIVEEEFSNNLNSSKKIDEFFFRKFVNK